MNAWYTTTSKAEARDAGEWDNLHATLGYCDLLVIDPVNELETFTAEWSNAR